MTTATQDGGLKLRAEDAEDINVISSSLQDALVAVADMTLLGDQRRFALVANRFCWEKPIDAQGGYQRSHTILAIDGVASVSMQGIDRQQSDRVLNLLAIETAIKPQGGVYVVLVFAGQAAIRLEVDRILCHLEDVGEPWFTRWKPAHLDE
ncbi:MAG: DUF2948 family protein [Rhodospirillales bacterium]